eukprot:1136805-Pelagomonas_calceolata.AAC.1
MPSFNALLPYHSKPHEGMRLQVVGLTVDASVDQSLPALQEQFSGHYEARCYIHIHGYLLERPIPPDGTMVSLYVPRLICPSLNPGTLEKARI